MRGVGQKGSSFFLLFLPPGTTTPPRFRPALVTLSQALPPPQEWGWGRAGPNDVGGGNDCSGLFFPPSTSFSTLFSWLVIGAEKRGAMGLDFQLISGF